MKTLAKILTVLLVVTLAGYAYGQDKPNKPAKPKGLRGEVVKVEGTNLVIKVTKEQQTQEVTIATDEKTQLVNAGEGAKVDSLQPGQIVEVVMGENNVAAKIAVAKPKPPKKDGETQKAGPKDGEGKKTGPKDGETQKTGPKDGEGKKTGPKDGEAQNTGPKDGQR